MILKNKKLLIATSLLTLLPIPVGLLLWNRFPETMVIHFGITGQPDMSLNHPLIRSFMYLQHRANMSLQNQEML